MIREEGSKDDFRRTVLQVTYGRLGLIIERILE